MASSEKAGQADADDSNQLWSVNPAALKMPLPQIVTTRKDIGKIYDERLKRFRENCQYLQTLTVGESRPNYSKEFLQCLEEVAESFYDLRGPMLARYPIEVSHYFRREQAEIFHVLEMVPVFTKHAKELLNEKLESKNERKVLEWCMFLLMNNCFNSLDVAHDLAKDKDYLAAAGRFLRDTPSKPDKFRHALTAWALQQIMYMSRDPSNSNFLHGANIPRVLLRFTRENDPEFCLAAVASLANIAEGESQGEDFRLSSDMVDTLISKIKEAWKSDTKSSTHWPFRELLEVVGQLAKNEDNRRVLVARGCLSPLTHLVSSNVLQDEIVALRTLWRLSLCEENKKKMAESTDLMDTIKKKFTFHSDANVIGLAHGVLFCLKNELKKNPDHKDIVRALDARKKTTATVADKLFAVSEQKSLAEELTRLKISPDTKTLRTRNAEAGRGMQVMLSYNRMHREKVKEICMFLLENGFRVWFDMNNMTADALDAVTYAVEASDVVCICFSQGYYQSAHCEMEAKYTVAKKKRVVFIKMEDYTPCGWLGIMMGTAFYVDYTGRKDYAMMRDLLIKELLQGRKNTEPAKMIEDKPTRDKEELSEQKSLAEELTRLKISTDTKTLRTRNAEAGRGMQVMLSYHHSHMVKVKEICMFLLENGFKVWFDQNHMRGNIFRAMATGIETSEVVCICYSHGYHSSPNCESEALYARDMGKRMVFIKMEDYTPCGWLGFIMSGASYVDYTGKKDYDMMRDELIDQLLQRRENTTPAKEIAVKPILEKEESPTKAPAGKDSLPAPPREAAAPVASENPQKPDDESRSGKGREDRKMTKEKPTLESGKSPTKAPAGKDSLPAPPREAAAPVASENPQKPDVESRSGKRREDRKMTKVKPTLEKGDSPTKAPAGKDSLPAPPREAAAPVASENPQKPDVESRSGKRREDRKLQVMLSYNRQHRPQVMKIYEFLEEKGFKVWIDKKKMAGDIINAMADAVLNSDVICICHSQAYTKSKNCEYEAKFAWENKKPIVPLKMEDYEPPEWLRFITTSLLYFDFSGKYKEEDVKDDLLRQLNELKKDIIGD